MEKIQQKYIQTVGLGIGEETKASTVEFLVNQLKAHTVLRSGGCQAGHHIIREDGTEHEFSLFGCGTFEGAKTHLSQMVIDPVQLFDEVIELEEKGVEDPLKMLTIDQNCISITPFHGCLSRIKEIYRVKKKGTIGMGVGDAIKDSKLSDDLVIHVSDFKGPESILREKVERIRQRKLKQASAIVADSPWMYYLEGAEKEFLILEDESLVDYVVESMRILADLVEITNDSSSKEVLAQKGIVIGEPSHGALLHPEYGFVPHTTQIDPTAEDVLINLENINYPGEILKIGVSRCYLTRHGAGPLVSYSRDLTSQIAETHNNANEHANEWLGEFRNGHFDLLAMQYAIEISGGKDSFDGLAISYLDKLEDFESWEVCISYTYEGVTDLDISDFFNVHNGQIVGIRKVSGSKDVIMAHTEKLTNLLYDCKPILLSLLPSKEKSLKEVFLDFVEERLNIPVVITAEGPKLKDRRINPKYQYIFEV